jgi:multidrug transporter EmrE-like cation transporter
MKTVVLLLPTVFLVVYSQIVVKWRTSQAAAASSGFAGFEQAILFVLKDPWVLSAYVAALSGSILWLIAVAKLPLSVAFPLYQGMVCVGVIVAGRFLFGEELQPMGVLGVVLILIGLTLTTLK